MGALEESSAVHALALAMAKTLEPEEASRLALLLTQLGTTLGTIVALQQLDTGSDSDDSTVQTAESG